MSKNCLTTTLKILVRISADFNFENDSYQHIQTNALTHLKIFSCFSADVDFTSKNFFSLTQVLQQATSLVPGMRVNISILNNFKHTKTVVLFCSLAHNTTNKQWLMHTLVSAGTNKHLPWLQQPPPYRWWVFERLREDSAYVIRNTWLNFNMAAGKALEHVLLNV